MCKHKNLFTNIWTFEKDESCLNNTKLTNYAQNIRFHALIIAIFGSLIAPFGGFLASGFKRAFKVKDFSKTIPGHGGITDRMDCQFLMASFSYLYYQSFVLQKELTVGYLISIILDNLSKSEIEELKLILSTIN